MRCHRCDRPICPDCMHPASVGFQCPECVKEGARSVRTPRTSFGGRIAADTSRVTQVLIGLNLAVFVYGLAREDLAVRFGNLALASDGSAQIGVAAGQYYRLLTAAFLHAGLLHIAFNMLALLSLGPTVEAALGRGRFLALYLLSALGGSVLSFLVSPPTTLGVGASGAIFGLFGAYYVLVRRVGGATGPILGNIGLNLVITFTLPIIDWRAHVGGLVAGTLLAAAFAYAPAGARRTLVQAAAVAALGVLLVLAVVVRAAVLTSVS